MNKTVEGLAEISLAENPALLQSEEFYSNQMERLKTEIESTAERCTERKMYLNRMVELTEKLQSEHSKSEAIADEKRTDGLRGQASDIQTAFENELAVLNSKYDKIQTRILKCENVLGEKQGNESLEDVIPKLKDGTYMASLEICKDGEDYSDIVWKLEPFGQAEMVKERDEIVQKTKDLVSTHEEVMAPIQAELKEILELDGRGNSDALIKQLKDDIEETKEKLKEYRDGRTLDEGLVSMKEELARLNELIKASMSRETQLSNLTAARDKANDAEREVIILKAAAKVISDYSERVTGEVLNGLLSIMNSFASGVMPFSYAVSGNEIGYYRDGVFVGNESFSGSEMALLRSAVTVAMASKGEFKIAILDELGRFDAQRKEKLFDNMIRLTDEGVIDQFVGVDVSPPQNIRNEITIVAPDA